MHILTAKRNGGRDVAGGVVISLATSFRPLYFFFFPDLTLIFIATSGNDLIAFVVVLCSCLLV